MCKSRPNAMTEVDMKFLNCAVNNPWCAAFLFYHDCYYYFVKASLTFLKPCQLNKNVNNIHDILSTKSCIKCLTNIDSRYNVSNTGVWANQHWQQSITRQLNFFSFLVANCKYCNTRFKINYGGISNCTNMWKATRFYFWGRNFFLVLLNNNYPFPQKAC